MKKLRVGSKLGKYRLRKRLGEGGFATVHMAYDTIEGVSVALKIPHARHVTGDLLEAFRKEVRIAARLDHPNIMHVKNAGYIDGVFVVAYPLGAETLGDRLTRRLVFRKALDYADQMLEAVAFAHASRIVHCDIKPENFILFEGDRIRLTDFGLAKIALATRTIHGSGAGTVGYLAPEQALGHPSFRSDVFGLSLVLFRMFSGVLPGWPFTWPVPGVEKLRGKVHADLIGFLRKGLQVDTRKRYADAVQMQAAFERIRPKVARYATTRRTRRSNKPRVRDWKTVQLNEFRRRFGKALAARTECGTCAGPISETMLYCPWCCAEQSGYRGPTDFPRRCERCHRGMKNDWRFCAFCFGKGYDADATREYSDRRYSARCANESCSRRLLMPYMRYCPWCRAKVRRKWRIPLADRHQACSRCGWGVLPEFWSYCPWCGKKA